MILQIVGYKNSGKTTLMTHTVQRLKQWGYSVVTVKHHGHAGEEITLPDVTVDHMRHFEAGADQSIVQGHDYVETIQRNHYPTLETLLAECVTMDDSIILIEGYKKATYPKVIVYKNKEDLDALRQLENVQFSMQWQSDGFDETNYDKWLKQWIREGEGEIR
ncbi:MULTISPECIES: molybdopterin-guanine dinucleotide biosynthesis protein B [unclassified Staphylococcus]|uniref:molybdopterin-guanine dinucleotide biosynthesis protein B n=1 Tax=unclassified Staphylococcus TaxID=91994 RepID=UPI0021D28506|nr:MULTISPECIES: molybdopterin-guanine dinucleotide biosynthesis protein B [unclassified Staphylococcus]UXR78007.1 molybdopterin-guanine dinucleotide biosynthesis protein B [Staphylococcus sp. IVB6227]UXR82168.1 molybdopterin-guanine dinucleotide biosynthesis protein B [Staphylococcus sp. IVB6214]